LFDVARAHHFALASIAASVNGRGVGDPLVADVMARALHYSARTTVDIDIEIQVEMWVRPEMSGLCTGKGVRGTSL
jgi:hypothetical protein